MVVSFYQSISVSSPQSRADIWVAAVIRNIAKTKTSCQFSSRSNHQTDRRWEENKIENPSILHKVIKLPFDPRFNLPDRSPHQGLTISACVWFLIDPLRLSPSQLLITDHSLHKMMETQRTREKYLESWLARYWMDDELAMIRTRGERTETRRILQHNRFIIPGYLDQFMTGVWGSVSGDF